MNQKLSSFDLIEIDRLKREQNLSNAKLGEMYDMTAPGIHRALKRFRGERVSGPTAEQQRHWRKQRTNQTFFSVVIHEEPKPSPEEAQKAKRLKFLRFRLAKLQEKKATA